MAWELRELAVQTITAHLGDNPRWPAPAVTRVEHLLDTTPHWPSHLVAWQNQHGWHAAWLDAALFAPSDHTHWVRIISIPRIVDHLWGNGYFLDRDLVAQTEAELAGIAWIPLDDGTLLVVDDDDESDVA